jgi:hypothetical protein
MFNSFKFNTVKYNAVPSFVIGAIQYISEAVVIGDALDAVVISDSMDASIVS